MQNKANLQVSQMNVTYVKTKNYEQKTMDYEPTKQTQSKPIELAFIGDQDPPKLYAKAGVFEGSIENLNRQLAIVNRKSAISLPPCIPSFAAIN